MSLAFRIINPIVRLILVSPLHALLSRNMLLLEFTGRRSGRQIALPVSYHEPTPGTLHCFTVRNGVWWKNLRDGAPVRVRLRGAWLSADAQSITAPQSVIASHLGEFLRAVPRDASHSGVRLNADGTPEVADVSAAAARHVLIQVRTGLPGSRRSQTSAQRQTDHA